MLTFVLVNSIPKLTFGLLLTLSRITLRFFYEGLGLTKALVLTFALVTESQS